MKKENKKINIYITNQDKKRLNEIKYKYHLSYSSIVNIITEKLIILYGEKLIKEKYYNDQLQYKTSIKPKNWEYINQYGQPSLIYTNSLKLFTRNELKKLGASEKQTEKVKNMIYNEFQNTYEENWDGNHFTRMMTRYIKRNPSYVKKILEE